MEAFHGKAWGKQALISTLFAFSGPQHAISLFADWMGQQILSEWLWGAR
jgi:hypothetical protein